MRDDHAGLVSRIHSTHFIEGSECLLRAKNHFGMSWGSEIKPTGITLGDPDDIYYAELWGDAKNATFWMFESICFKNHINPAIYIDYHRSPLYGHFSRGDLYELSKMMMRFRRSVEALEEEESADWLWKPGGSTVWDAARIVGRTRVASNMDLWTDISIPLPDLSGRPEIILSINPIYALPWTKKL